MTIQDPPPLHPSTPPWIAVSSGALLDATPPLNQSEAASIASIKPMSPQRMAEFAQGRKHARKALAQLGVYGVGVPMEVDRSPLWPQGFVGSISHVPAHQNQLPGWVIAVAARAEDCAGLGVDLERDTLLMPEEWPRYMTEREMSWMRVQAIGLRNNLAHALWSAKEATMKALTLALDPHQIEVQVHTDGLVFEAQYHSQPNDGADVVTLNGWLSFGNGWVLALTTR